MGRYLPKGGIIMGYRETEKGTIKIWLDAEYANSDRDDLLEIVYSRNGARAFAEKWATNKALQMGHGLPADEFQTLKNVFKRQLCYTGWEDAPED